MSLSKDDILNAIAEMSVMDVVALVEAMEEKFGVTAAAAVAAAPAAAGGALGAGEKAPRAARDPDLRFVAAWRRRHLHRHRAWRCPAERAQAADARRDGGHF